MLSRRARRRIPLWSKTTEEGTSGSCTQLLVLAPVTLVRRSCKPHPPRVVFKMADVKEIAKQIADAYEEGVKLPSLESAVLTRGWDSSGRRVISKWTQKDLKRNKKLPFLKEHFISVEPSGDVKLGQEHCLSREQNV